MSRIDVAVRRDEVDEPHGVAVARDGRHWYVTVAHGDPTLWKFESAGDRLVGRLRLGTKGAARIGLTPDGRFAFVPDYLRSRGTTGEVAIVRTDDLRLLARLEVCAAPHDAQASPDGTLVAVTCSGSDEVVILHVADRTIVRRFAVEANPAGLNGPSRPLNVVWTPDGRFLHVTLSAASRLRTFSVDGHPVAEVRVGESPGQLALAEDGRVLVTANRLDGTVSVVGVSRSGDGIPLLAERRRFELGVAFPHGVALTPDGRWAFVAWEGMPGQGAGAMAIATADGRIAWRTEMGAYLLGAAYAVALSGS